MVWVCPNKAFPDMPGVFAEFETKSVYRVLGTGNQRWWRSALPRMISLALLCGGHDLATGTCATVPLLETSV